MFYRDPKCVFVANDVAHAAATVNWLEHQDVRAQVMDSLTHGGLDGLNAWTGVSARGIEVWVLDPSDVDRAKTLVAQHQKTLESLLVKKASAGPVSAHCEECGREGTFPGEHRGTVQTCPHCGAYLDVPDGDEDTGDELDYSFGTDESHTETNLDNHSNKVAPTMPRLQSLKRPIIGFAVSAMIVVLVAGFLANVLHALLR